MVTIAYGTCRKQPHIEWFLDSLKAQGLSKKLPDSQILVVDFWKNERNGEFCKMLENAGAVHVRTKPSTWQGDDRLTKEDWHCCSVLRNTGLLMAPDGYICYIDDVSVPLPTWVDSLVEATKRDGVTAGAYRKVKDLVVKNGIIESFTDHPNGYDSRIVGNSKKPYVHYPDLIKGGGGWIYGCCSVSPVESLLAVGGWPETLCDGCCAEDGAMSFLLENNGTNIWFDSKLMSYESEEAHWGTKFKARDYGVSPNDKTHKIIETSRKSKFQANNFGEDGIRGLRQRILAGEPFPKATSPTHEWFTGIALKDLD